MRKRTFNVTCGAVISAMYTALTVFTRELSSFAIQLRFAEALCIFPAITPAAIPGLAIGCALSNFISGNIIDTVFGALATLLAAILTRLLSKLLKGRLFWLYPVPAVIINTVFVPLILYYGYGFTSFGSAVGTFSVLSAYALSIFISEGIVCFGLGLPLYLALKKHQRIFLTDYKNE